MAAPHSDHRRLLLLLLLLGSPIRSRPSSAAIWPAQLPPATSGGWGAPGEGRTRRTCCVGSSCGRRTAGQCWLAEALESNFTLVRLAHSENRPARSLARAPKREVTPPSGSTHPPKCLALWAAQDGRQVDETPKCAGSQQRIWCARAKETCNFCQPAQTGSNFCVRLCVCLPVRASERASERFSGCRANTHDRQPQSSSRSGSTRMRCQRVLLSPQLPPAAPLSSLAAASARLRTSIHFRSRPIRSLVAAKLELGR